MKIRTQIHGLMLATALILSIALGGVLYTEQIVRQKRQDVAAAEALVRSVIQLRQIAVETILFHGARSQDQWRIKISSLKIQLEKMRASHADDQASIDLIRKNLLITQSIYARLIQARETVSGQQTLDITRDARATASLFVITQEVLDVGYEMARNNLEEATLATYVRQGALGTAVLILTLFLVLVWRLVARSILRPLQQFEQGTARIAEGDYTYRLRAVQEDEMGDLARSFDSMTTHVQQTQSALVAEASNSRRAESALQESARFTQTILESALDGIVALDEQGAIQSANPAFATIFGYVPQELIGCNFKMLLPERERDEFYGALARYREGYDVEWQRRELQGWHKDQYEFPIELALSRTMHHGQALFIAIVRDISERQRIDRMKSEFVSTVSHELRTPLTSISGALGLVLGGALGELPQGLRPLLDIAFKNSQRLKVLIDDLLDMEKLIVGKLDVELQPQALMPLIEHALESAHDYAAQWHISYTVAARVDAARVKVDSRRLQQVMLNLLSNAAKFSPPGGQVKIVVSQEQDRVTVAVIDQGPGVPEDFRDRLFQKFAQADSSDTRQKSGTGLGLAISKELIERMQGVIGYRSAPGEGACFYFELPLCASPESPLSS